MTYQDLIEQTIEHISTMAMNPATLDHARWRVRQLRDDKSGLFENIVDLVSKRIEEKKNVEKKMQAQSLVNKD